MYAENIPDFMIVDKADNKWERDDLSQAWEEMWANKNTDIRNFAVDLFVYSYLTTGFKTNIFSFFDLAPSSMIRDLGYNTYIRNTLREYGSGVYDPAMLNEIYRSAWNNKNIVPEIEYKDVEYVGLSENMPYMVTTTKDKYYVGVNETRDPIAIPYIKYKHNFEYFVLEYQGYVPLGDGRVEYVYTPIEKKGKSFRGHMVREDMFDQSIFPGNKLTFEPHIQKWFNSDDMEGLIKRTEGMEEFEYVRDKAVNYDTAAVQELEVDDMAKKLNVSPIELDAETVGKITSGEQVYLNLQSATEQGFRTMPNNGLIHLKYIEGFDMGDDISLHSYKVTHYGFRTPTPEEVEQHKIECNG